MKIGFDAKRAFNNQSGLGNYSRDVIRAILTKKTDDVFLFTPRQNAAIFDIKDVEVVEPQSVVNKMFKAYWRSSSIKKDIKDLQLDIFHGLSNELPLGIDQSIKTIVTIHDLIFKRYPQWYKPVDRFIYNKKFSAACRNADKIIAISEQTKADIIHFYGIDTAKIEVVYQTCNAIFKREKDKTQIEQVKKKYNLPDTFLLNVGTIEARKNALNIVKALHQHKIETPLFIIGRDTPYAQTIKQYIADNNLEKQIKILHNISNEELPVFYQLAQIFIYPSTFEGFGIPIIEALYSGTPVISSTGSCFSEAGGPATVYVEPNNIDELAKAIEDIGSDTEKQKNMIRQGLEYAQNFNTPIVTDKLYKVYQEIIQ